MSQNQRCSHLLCTPRGLAECQPDGAVVEGNVASKLTGLKLFILFNVERS
jgi:hypothetical protein